MVPIQWRYEGEVVPDGVSLTLAGRLHIVYQERRGSEVFRLHVAIPCHLDPRTIEYLELCSADTETLGPDA
jgi:hypothetical protein